MSKIGWLYALLLCCLAAFSGDESASTEPDQTTILETITVTAERAPVTIKESTAKVSVIEDEDIQKRVVNDFRDLIKYEPGVTIDNDGSRLGLNGFNIRGIGANRVLTQIDGVAAPDQFAFGPLSIHRQSLDVDTIKAVEILRGASSSLYGSNALGGVVSFITKDPSDYLMEWGGDRGFTLKSGYDGKNDAFDMNLIGAFSSGDFQGMMSVNQREYGPRDNQGTIDSLDFDRTTPNDIDGSATQVLAKLVRNFSSNNRLRLSLEWYGSDTDTMVYSQQGATSVFGIPTDISDNRARDEQQRWRVSLDQEWQGLDLALLDSLQWKLHYQTSATDQFTTEQRVSDYGNFSSSIVRSGTNSFDHDNLGADLVLGKTLTANGTTHRFTYGISIEQASLVQVRDRHDLDLATGNPDSYTGTLIFPTRYFPNSDVDEYGFFFQSESYFLDGRLKVIPGFRYDRYALSPDKNDRVYIDSTGSEVPVSMDDSAFSPKLGIYGEVSSHLALTAHYAHGFRAPPYQSVNSGFTNLAGGYQTLPNPDLEAESSENLELGMKWFNQRGSLSINWFDNAFEDFIEDTLFVGVSPTGIALFQAANIDNVDISGFEIVGDYNFDGNWKTRFSFADSKGENAETGDPIASIEPRKAVLGLLWQHSSRRFGGEVSGTFTAAKDEEDMPASETPLFLPASSEILDLTLFYDLSRQLQFHLGAFNLTDETHYLWTDVRGRSEDATISRYSAPGRYLSVNARYRW